MLTFITYHHVQKSYGELSIFRTPYTVEQKRDSIYVILQLIKMKINFLQVHILSVLFYWDSWNDVLIILYNTFSYKNSFLLYLNCVWHETNYSSDITGILAFFMFQTRIERILNLQNIMNFFISLWLGKTFDILIFSPKFKR